MNGLVTDWFYFIFVVAVAVEFGGDYVGFDSGYSSGSFIIRICFNTTTFNVYFLCTWYLWNKDAAP